MNERIINYCDRVSLGCLYLAFFCIPFAKAGVEAFVWLAIFLWLLKRILGYRVEGPLGLFPKTRLNKALVVFFCINMLSIPFSQNQGLSFSALFGKILKFIFIYFMVVETINSEKRVRILFNISLLLASLIITDAAIQFFVGKDFIKDYFFNRLKASFSNSNGFAAWLIMLIPVFGITLLARSTKTFNSWMKVVTGVFVILLSICLVLTYSRGAWLGLLISLFLGSSYLFVMAQAKTKRFIIGALIPFIIIAGIGGCFLKPFIRHVLVSKYNTSERLGDRIKSTVHIREGSALERMLLWQEALEIIKDFPVLGTGLNTYTIIIPRYKTFEEGAMYPHNSFLHMTAETGILGLLSFLWVLFEFFKAGILYLAKRNDLIVLGLVCGITAFLAQSFVDNNLYSLPLVVLFWFMMGLTVAMMNLGSKQELLST